MKRASPFRVLIADDHQLIREGLKRALIELWHVRHVEEASTAQEVLDRVNTQPLDIVILDIQLPGRSGLEVLKEIRRDHPTLPVLVLSMFPEDQFAVRVIRAGADGYLTKASAMNELIQALDTIRQGKKYINARVAEKLFDAVQRPSDLPLHEQLSDREQEVFQWIASGKTVGEIAHQLCLSVKTVSTYRSNILRKLSVKNNSQIIRYAVEHGLMI